MLRRRSSTAAVSAPAFKSVCFITETNGFGGTEVHTLGLMKALVVRGYQVTVIACRHRQYDESILSAGLQHVIRVHHTDLIMNDYEGTSVRRWKALLAMTKSDVVIMPKGWNGHGNLMLHLLCRRVFKRLFIIEHLEADPAPVASVSWNGAISALKRLKRKMTKHVRARTADAIVAVSSQVRNRLVQDWGYCPDRITVVRNGVPWREFARDQKKGKAFRSTHEIPAGAYVFGMVTRLSPEKGVDIALKAFRLVLDQNADADIQLVVAGTGRDAETLSSLCERLGLADRVHFVGFIRDAIGPMSAFDVILFPSRNEGLPLGLLEAMAAGCVPIVSRISGMPEAVASPRIGWVVAPENPAELAAAMTSALRTDPGELTRMRQAAVAQIRDQFDIEATHQKIFKRLGL